MSQFPLHFESHILGGNGSSRIPARGGNLPENDPFERQRQGVLDETAGTNKQNGGLEDVVCPATETIQSQHSK